jgi:hypothetical protein
VRCDATIARILRFWLEFDFFLSCVYCGILDYHDGWGVWGHKLQGLRYLLFLVGVYWDGFGWFIFWAFWGYDTVRAYLACIDALNEPA